MCGTHVNRLVFPDVVGCVRSSVQYHEWDDTFDIWMSHCHTTDFREKLFIIAPSTAIKMLKYCCNATKVTLGICLNGDQVKEIVKKMKHLRKLEICYSTSMPIKPIIAATGCANLEKLVLRGAHAPDVKHVQNYLSEWVHVGFHPPNLSIVFYAQRISM